MGEIGLNAKLYRNTGTFGVPVWVEVDIVEEVSTSIEKVMAEIKNRKSKWTKNKSASRSASIDIELSDDQSDAGFIALRDAFLNDTLIDLAVLSGAVATTGTQGLRAEFEVSKFERSEERDEELGYSITIVPGVSANGDPTWMVI